VNDLRAIIRSLTKAQRSALDTLAIGQLPHCAQRTLEALYTRGLIVPEMRGLTTSLGLFNYVEWIVPIPVHMAWAQVWGTIYLTPSAFSG
jgi:hypothetical protein